MSRIKGNPLKEECGRICRLNNTQNTVKVILCCGIKARLNKVVFSVEESLQRGNTSSRFLCLFFKQADNTTMKTCSFLVTLSFTIVLVKAFNTEEHVKRFFRPEHRVLLPAITSLQLQDESIRAPAPQNDDSTKCLAPCEPTCAKLEVPDFLEVNFTLQCFISGFTSKMMANIVKFLLESDT